MIASAGFQTLTYFSCDSLKERMLGRRRALGAVPWGAEQSEDSTTGETEGGFDELRESCGHTCSADVVVAPYEKTNRLGFHLRCLGICTPTRSKHTTSRV